MIKILKDIFNSIGIKSFFSERGSYKDECIVYNYIQAPADFADNTETASKYTILVNLYSRVSNVEKTKKLVRETLLSNGFKGGTVQNTNKESDGLYNTPILFKKSIRY